MSEIETEIVNLIIEIVMNYERLDVVVVYNEFDHFEVIPIPEKFISVTIFGETVDEYGYLGYLRENIFGLPMQKLRSILWNLKYNFSRESRFKKPNNNVKIIEKIDELLVKTEIHQLKVETIEL